MTRSTQTTKGMGYKGNYICLTRDIRRHWIWGNATYLRWWLYLLMAATYTAQTIIYDGQTVRLLPNQLATSIRILESDWAEGPKKPSKEKILKFLRMLEKEGMIKRESSLPRNGTLITICDSFSYGDYYCAEGTETETLAEQSRKQSRNSRGTVAETSIKQIKEEKKRKEGKVNNTATDARSLREAKRSRSLSLLELEHEFTQKFWAEIRTHLPATSVRAARKVLHEFYDFYADDDKACRALREVTIANNFAKGGPGLVIQCLRDKLASDTQLLMEEKANEERKALAAARKEAKEVAVAAQQATKDAEAISQLKAAGYQLQNFTVYKNWGTVINLLDDYKLPWQENACVDRVSALLRRVNGYRALSKRLVSAQNAFRGDINDHHAFLDFTIGFEM